MKIVKDENLNDYFNKNTSNDLENDNYNHDVNRKVYNNIYNKTKSDNNLPHVDKKDSFSEYNNYTNYTSNINNTNNYTNQTSSQSNKNLITITTNQKNNNNTKHSNHKSNKSHIPEAFNSKIIIEKSPQQVKECKISKNEVKSRDTTPIQRKQKKYEETEKRENIGVLNINYKLSNFNKNDNRDLDDEEFGIAVELKLKGKITPVIKAKRSKNVD